MCLESVKEQYSPPKALVRDGWKVFNGTQKTPAFQNFSHKGVMAVPLDRWLKADGPTIQASDNKTYSAGFHVYVDEAATKKKDPGARRVYTRQIHTLGEQGKLPVVVANELYVPSDPEAWPPL